MANAEASLQRAHSFWVFGAAEPSKPARSKSECGTERATLRMDVFCPHTVDSAAMLNASRSSFVTNLKSAEEARALKGFLKTVWQGLKPAEVESFDSMFSLIEFADAPSLTSRGGDVIERLPLRSALARYGALTMTPGMEMLGAALADRPGVLDGVGLRRKLVSEEGAAGPPSSVAGASPPRKRAKIGDNEPGAATPRSRALRGEERLDAVARACTGGEVGNAVRRLRKYHDWPSRMAEQGAQRTALNALLERAITAALLGSGEAPQVVDGRGAANSVRAALSALGVKRADVSDKALAEQRLLLRTAWASRSCSGALECALRPVGQCPNSGTTMVLVGASEWQNATIARVRTEEWDSTTAP